MYQFSGTKRPKFCRKVQEIKSGIVQALSVGKRFIYVDLSNSSVQIEMFAANQFSKDKQAKLGCYTARSQLRSLATAKKRYSA